MFSNREHWGKGSGFHLCPYWRSLSILLAAGQHQHPGALGGNAQLQRTDWWFKMKLCPLIHSLQNPSVMHVKKGLRWVVFSFKPVSQSPVLHKPGMVAHTCNSSIWELDTEWSVFKVHGKSEASLGYLWLCFRMYKQTEKEPGHFFVFACTVVLPYLWFHSPLVQLPASYHSPMGKKSKI